jgi:hypothetical protein
MMISKTILAAFTLFATGVAATAMHDFSILPLFGSRFAEVTNQNNDDSSLSQQELANGECRVALRVMAYDDEIEDGESSPARDVSTFRYPIYNPSRPSEPIGIYIGVSTGTGGNDCFGTGAFNFDYNHETNSYDSQIFVSVSCSGDVNNIIGGTGSFAFIRNGHEVITDATGMEGATISELHFTSETCGRDATSWSRRW